MFDQFLLVLKEQEPIISSIVGLTTMLAAIWGVVQLMFIASKNKTAVDAAQKPATTNPSARAGPLRTVLDLGLTSYSELEELVSVRTINTAALCLIMINLCWVIAGLFVEGMIILTVVNGITFLSFLMVLVLQGTDRSESAKWLFISSLIIYWVVIMVVAGKFRGIEYFFPGLIIFPVLLFSKQHKRGKFLALIFMSAAFFAAVALQNRYEAQLLISESFFNVAYYMNVVLLGTTLYLLVNFYNNFAASNFHDLEQQKSRTDELVNSLLPAYVAERVRDHESTVADWHSEATVLFATISGFETLYHRVSAVQLVELLSDVFNQFDELIKKYNIDKVNTLGTNYVVATGIGEDEDEETDHAAIAMFALDALELVRKFSQTVNHPFSFRAGISTGQVISGVIGDARPCFDIWGETVELANSMRDTAVSNSIVVNEPAYWRLRENYDFAVTDEPVASYLLLKRKTV
ncbi:MAG: adenylate/guanylate cyclase domain-containing protein [Halioglobus sp.]